MAANESVEGEKKKQRNKGMQEVLMMSHADDDGDDDDELKVQKDFSRPCRRGALINMPLTFKEGGWSCIIPSIRHLLLASGVHLNLKSVCNTF